MPTTVAGAFGHTIRFKAKRHHLLALCAFGPALEPLGASVSSSIKWAPYHHLTGLLQDQEAVVDWPRAALCSVSGRGRQGPPPRRVAPVPLGRTRLYSATLGQARLYSAGPARLGQTRLCSASSAALSSPWPRSAFSGLIAATLGAGRAKAPPRRRGGSSLPRALRASGVADPPPQPWLLGRDAWWCRRLGAPVLLTRVVPSVVATGGSLFPALEAGAGGGGGSPRAWVGESLLKPRVEVGRGEGKAGSGLPRALATPPWLCH